MCNSIMVLCEVFLDCGWVLTLTKGNLTLVELGEVGREIGRREHQLRWYFSFL